MGLGLVIKNNLPAARMQLEDEKLNNEMWQVLSARAHVILWQKISCSRLVATGQAKNC